MSVTGDFDKIARWQKNFEAVARGEYREDANRDCGKATLELVREGFEKEKDPFGNPWKPKVIPNGTKILHGPNRWKPYTPGRLRIFRVIKVSKDGFGVESMASYFNPHQFGFRHNKSKRRITKRQMVPGNVLPIRWSSTYARITNRHIKAMLMR